MALKNVKLGVSKKVAFAPDGDRLAVLGSDLSVWDIDSQKRLFRVRPLSHISQMAFSPTGECIALKNTSGQIALVNQNDGKLLRELDSPAVAGSGGASPVFSHCGGFIADGTWRGELVLYSCKTGKKVFDKSFDSQMITSIVRLNKGKKWFTVHEPVSSDDAEFGAPAHLIKWNWPLPDSKQQKLKLAIYEPNDAAADPTGKALFIVNEFCNVHVYAVGGLKLRHEIEYDSPVTGIRWSHDGKYLIIVADNKVDVYDSKTFDIYASFNKMPATDCDISPSGEWVAVGSRKNGLLVPRENFFPAK